MEHEFIVSRELLKIKKDNRCMIEGGKLSNWHNPFVCVISQQLNRVFSWLENGLFRLVVGMVMEKENELLLVILDNKCCRGIKEL